MKHLSYKTIITLTALSAVLFTASCRKKDNAAPKTPKGLLYLHMHTNIGAAEVDAGTVGTDATGRKFSLYVAQFYLSDITLHKADGSSVALTGAYMLKTIDQEEYYIDSVETGNYVSISFNVGVDSIANKNMPSAYPATNPLSEQNPAMWFGSVAQGYMFMNIQGLVDTTAAQIGAANYPFSYQIGTSAMLKTVNMPNEAFSVTANQPALVHLEADYGILLHGINLRTNSTASPFSNAATATQIANNIPSMFRYEE